MKKLITLLCLTTLSVTLLSQSPRMFNYQAVVRDASGQTIVNQTVNVQMSILQYTADGTALYVERFLPVTNDYGLINLAIGTGTVQSGSFAGIDWSDGPYFIKTEVDPDGGTSFTELGTSMLLSVPYALYSSKSGTWSELGDNIFYEDGKVGIGTTNPFNLLEVKGIIGAQDGNSDNWNEAYSWGNHALEGYLTGFTEEDPNFNKAFRLDGDTVYKLTGSLAIGRIGPNKTKLAVTGDDERSEDALFEVRRADGQAVFSVYNEGVRVYVPTDPHTKGPKGGFAIGGFDITKGEYTEDYLYVTPDSIRMYIDKTPEGKGPKGGFAIGGFDRSKGIIDDFMVVNADSTRFYIDDTGTKGPKGGFAIGGFDQTKGSNQFFNVSPGTEGSIDPSENRVLWYPIKNAFLTGRVLIQHSDSVGENSFASGFESKAVGQYSQALGYQAIARGNNSTSIGYNSVAHKDNSFAFGNNTTASGVNSVALGSGANAKGNYSFALGAIGVDSTGTLVGNTIALDDYSFAIGQGATSNSTGAFAIGTETVSTGIFSTALGYKAETDGYYALALGPNTEALNRSAIAIGDGATASADYSVAIRGSASNSYSIAIGSSSATGAGAISLGGAKLTYAQPIPNPSISVFYQAIAAGKPSMAMGYGVGAGGNFSIALGTGSDVFTIPSGGTRSNGNFSVAIGHYAHSDGNYSKAMGDHVTAYSAYETVLGRYNKSRTPGSTTDWISTDPLFVIGNGTGSSAKSDAMVILKNGEVYFPEVYDNPVGVTIDLHMNPDGEIGYQASSRKYKTQIEDMENVDWLYSLKPVNFVYKEDKSKSKQYGLIAEEVDQVNKSFVFYNDKGEPETVLYDRLTAPMLKAIQEQKMIIQQKDKEIQALRDRLAKIEAMLGIAE